MPDDFMRSYCIADNQNGNGGGVDVGGIKKSWRSVARLFVVFYFIKMMRKPQTDEQKSEDEQRGI